MAEEILPDDERSSQRLDYEYILLTGLLLVHRARCFIRQGSTDSVALYADCVAALENRVSARLDKRYFKDIEPVDSIQFLSEEEIRNKLGQGAIYGEKVKAMKNREFRKYWKRVGRIKELALMGMLQRMNKLDERVRPKSKSIITPKPEN